MELARTPIRWLDVLTVHARAHPFSAAGLAFALLAVALLLAQSLFHVVHGDASAAAYYALLGGTAGFAGTTLGALPAFFLKGIPQKVEDTLLGLAAGMMLAAVAFSLLLPGLEAG